ncbi:SDR family NAD(P)-dependent oxidoreductase [Paenibacillus sp. YIM B09110]|uniref:SDR family NAD(P)-dependent oxidoreductase n=1 Tax=Paenibacillus sp. YIM B09110 TaxID=3126102 RepID=UPI00301BC7D4
MRFTNKVVLVTGGASGIGEVSAELFAGEGACVVIADRNGEEAIRLANELTGKYPSATGLARAVPIRTDVSREADVISLLEQVRQLCGRLDVLYNNASIIMPKRIEDIESEDFDRLIAVNLKSVYLMIKHALPLLRASKGTIVNMASLNGLTGQRNNPIYAATKGGIIALTKSLALDLAADGIRVNAICPAGVSTPLLEAWTAQQEDPAATIRLLNDMHALGRPAAPAEVAQAVMFLASEQASFITGVALPVEGGASLGY